MTQHSIASPHPTRPVSLAGDGDPILSRLRRDGYDFVPGLRMRDLLDRHGLADWDGFARSWDDLAPDRFMADGGTYRKRRFASLSLRGRDIRPKPAQPHYQTRRHNPLNGGVARIFEPVHDTILAHPAHRAVLLACGDLFAAATPAGTRPGTLPGSWPGSWPTTWHVETHQFRIEAAPGVGGKPTPEGLHRDGVDWVLVMMVRRENVADGVSSIADEARRVVACRTLVDPYDASLLDDRRVFHGVSPIRPVDPARPAWRDVLVVTFRAEPRTTATEA